MKKGIVGHILLATRLEAQDVNKVREAARVASIPEEYVRDVQSWNAFKRAMQQLEKRGVLERGNRGVLRDKFLETEEEIKVQFSSRWLASKGVKYRRTEIVTFHSNGIIHCTHSRTAKIVRELLAECKMMQSTTDIHKVCYRLMDDNFKRICLKDGVYFIPKGYETVLEQLRVFYTKLGASFWLQPIGATAEGIKNVADALVDDMRETVEKIKARIEEYRSHKKGNHGLTQDVANNALIELKNNLYRYHQIARTLHRSVGGILKTAGVAGDILACAPGDREAIVQLAKRGRVQPFVSELAKIALGAVSVSKNGKAKEIKVLPIRRVPVVNVPKKKVQSA